MNRRAFLQWTPVAGLKVGLSRNAFCSTVPLEQPHAPSPAPKPPASPETILLKDYRPQSIHKIPVARAWRRARRRTAPWTRSASRGRPFSP